MAIEKLYLLNYYTVWVYLFFGAVFAELSNEKPGQKIITYMTPLNNMLNVITAFALGFYLCVSVKRWWTIRIDCLGTLHGAITNLVQTVSTCLLNDNERNMYILLLVIVCYLNNLCINVPI
eukprot:UN30503